MCITAITKKEPIKVGYKIGIVNSDNLFSCFGFTNHPIPLNKWVWAKCPNVFQCGSKYPLGFHIFNTKSAAERYRNYTFRSSAPHFHGYLIYKVEYMGILAEGIEECGLKTIVSPLMRVIGAV